MSRYVPALAALLLCATPAAAQTCIPRDKAVAALSERHGEAQQSIALTANQMVLETWANLETGSWTVMITRPDGTTCMVASGTAFQVVPQVPAGVEG